MASHSSTFAWKIPWMEEPGRLQSMGSLESDTTEQLHFHFSLLCAEEGNGNPLQCSCLENPRDGGAWWAAVYGGAQGRTWLKWLSSSSSSIGDLTPCSSAGLLTCGPWAPAPALLGKLFEKQTAESETLGVRGWQSVFNKSSKLPTSAFLPYRPWVRVGQGAGDPSKITGPGVRQSWVQAELSSNLCSTTFQPMTLRL